jgi:hypothetical protein
MAAQMTSYIVIRADQNGPVVEEHPDGHHAIQELVNGYFQMCPVLTPKKAAGLTCYINDCVLNEKGGIKDEFKNNYSAGGVARLMGIHGDGLIPGVIIGTAVFANTAENGDTIPVTPEQIEAVNKAWRRYCKLE